MAARIALIRSATLADAAEIARLSAQLGYPAEVAVFADRLERLLPLPTHALLVCEGADGRLAGFIGLEQRLMIESGDKAEVVGLVVDADALNALAENPDALPKHAAPRVLTPHPGEFARLIGRSRIEHHERETLAREFAQRTGTVLVLKGSRTVITDGPNVRLNLNGNPGMAAA